MTAVSRFRFTSLLSCPSYQITSIMRKTFTTVFKVVRSSDLTFRNINGIADFLIKKKSLKV